MRSLIIHGKGEAILGRGGLTLEDLPVRFQEVFPEVSPKYIDSLSLLAGLAAREALRGSPGALEEKARKECAVVLGSAFGAIESMLEFDAQALLKGPNAVNPMDFPNTVANAAGSRVGIWLKLTGPNVTLTNGDTAFLDALGFAWEGLQGGLFKRGLVGAVEKVPSFLRPMETPSGPVKLREGAFFLQASGERGENALFEVTGHFAAQLKPDATLPSAFSDRFDALWDGVDWLGCPKGTPLEPRFPVELERFTPSPGILELGMGGLESLNAFLASPAIRGVLGVFSRAERKISLVRVEKTGRSV